jgi:hypothetical protein
MMRWRWIRTGLAVLLCGPAGAALGQTPLLFRDACAAGEKIVIAGVGDLLFHEMLQRQALTPETNYTGYFAAVAPVLQGADITYGNLEGPAAHGVVQGGRDWKDPGRVYDGLVYGTAKDALIFNYHPSVASDLKAAGFSVLSTANNHAADRQALGIDRTIAALSAAGLQHTGTRQRQPDPAPATPLIKASTAKATAEKPGALAGRWSTVSTARHAGGRGMKVAWLACSFGTNGMPDRQGQVLNCYQNRDIVMTEITRLAADPAISAVILTPHWGDENASKPKPGDRAYARAAIEAGATAIIGAHPHVLQPWERIETSDGREGLVIYSTGNFISNQHTTSQRSGIIAVLELTRDPASGKGRLTAAGFVPTWVEKQVNNGHDDTGHRIVEQVDGTSYRGEPPAKPVKSGKAASSAVKVGDDGLAATLKLLPANRVSLASYRNLPRDCPPPALPAPPAQVAEPEAQMVVAALDVRVAAPVLAPVLAGPIAKVPALPDQPAGSSPGPVRLQPAPPAAVTVLALASFGGGLPAGALSQAVNLTAFAAATPFDRQPPPAPRADPVLRTRRPNRSDNPVPAGLQPLSTPLLPEPPHSIMPAVVPLPPQPIAPAGNRRQPVPSLQAHVRPGPATGRRQASRKRRRKPKA